ncbi:hypothetical protein CDV31_004846 [Fusarium ambrosium]|uniref:PNPLA domain-containing protein n=1 Tax=Fusarium ambrosium TaxID=131363 RepID=A0A428UN58_9HYPO|nr:hypothetical protein CDV31_004846 [Fusarium ambrosium]
MKHSASPVDEGSSVDDAMPHRSTPQNEVIRPILLSLDGGGAKGLSTLLILQELMERIDRDNPPKPCDVFDMIGGTSTGGLIAIMLGRLEMSVADCIEAYQHISRQVFRPTFCGKYMPRAMRTITGRSMYDSQKLEDVVKNIIQAWGEAPNAPLETTDDDRCKVFVCATQCLKRSQVQFCSYRDPVHHNRADGIKIWEAARATSAASAYFDPIKIGPHSLEFVDGGIGTNNPVFETRNCARDLWQASNDTNFDEQIQCLVSIGAGVGQSYSAKEATASRLTVPAGIGNIDLVDTSKPEDILGRTFAYLKENCKRTHNKRSRIGFVAFKTDGSVSGPQPGSGCRWIVLCLTMVVLIIGIIFANIETSVASWYRAFINGRNVYLVDTPGFDDNNVSDLRILEHISKELHRNYQNGRRLNGIIYLYDISQVRIGASGLKQLSYIKALMGDEAFGNCAIVTNKWHLNSPSIQSEQQIREQELKRDHWKDMISGGSTVMRHDGSLYSAKRIISYLIDKPKIVLHHQHERKFWQAKPGTKAEDDVDISDSTLGTFFGRLDAGPGVWGTVQEWIWWFRVQRQ